MKRIKGLILAMVVLCMLVSISLNANAEEEESNEIITYNCETKGEEVRTLVNRRNFDEEIILEPYIPEDVRTDIQGDFISPFTIIGSDNQTKADVNTYPYCAIVMLTSGWDKNSDGTIDEWTRGTGYLVEKNVLMTAGHNVYDSARGGWVGQCRIYILQSGSSLANSYYYPMGYTCSTMYTTSEASEYDWSVITLKDNLGSEYGWLGVGKTAESLYNTTVTLSGYPGQTARKLYYQYKQTGLVTSSTSYYLNYAIDTEKGQSGSPVFDSDYISWGTHITGATTYNSALRFSTTMLNTIQNVASE